MQAAGFIDFERGARGSTAENQSCLQYQIERDKERLADIESKIAVANEDLEKVLPVQASVQVIDNIGKKTLTGKSADECRRLYRFINLAKECPVNRRTVQILESSNRALSDKIQRLQAELAKLKKMQAVSGSVKGCSQKVKEFIDGILKSLRKTAPEQEKSIFHKPPEKEIKSSPWELPVPAQKPKSKKKENFER